MSEPLELQTQKPYALDQLAQLQAQIMQSAQGMVVQRARIEKQRRSNIEAARDTYTELDRARGRLIEQLSKSELFLLEMEEYPLAAAADQLRRGFAGFNLMSMGYKPIYEALAKFTASFPTGQKTNAAIVGRLMNNIKLGYYPTDPDHISLILRGIRFPEGVTTNIFDPCCGCGKALRQLAQGNNCYAYGVELDESYKTGEKLTAAFLEGLEDYGTAPELEVWGVSGLHLEPEISAEGEGGAELGAPIAQDGATVYLPASDEELESAQAGYSETFFGLYAAFESNLNDKIDTNYYNMLSYLYGSLPLATRLASEYSARTPAGGVTDTDYDKYELGSFQYYGDNCYGCNVSLYEGGKQTGGCVIIFTRINAKWYPAEVWEYSF